MAEFVLYSGTLTGQGTRFIRTTNLLISEGCRYHEILSSIRPGLKKLRITILPESSMKYIASSLIEGCATSLEGIANSFILCGMWDEHERLMSLIESFKSEASLPKNGHESHVLMVLTKNEFSDIS